MPNPATASTSPAVGSLWILSPGRDMLLFLLTPVLILPAILGAEGVFTTAAISAFVMAFGAMGHHLPGMMRAYGDRALFRRFRTRFLLAPIVLVVLCVGFALKGSHGMLVVAYAWGVWHGWMQTYGFMRIYDAKVGSFAPITARLDFGVCAAWFLGGVIFSDNRVHYLQEMLVDFGATPLSAVAVGILRNTWVVVLVAVTLGYFVNSAVQARAGRPTNPVKGVLIAASVAWWWYANVYVTDILIGLILFEIFHDVQYLAIVWVFNRGRVQQEPGVGRFTRFVFRRSWGLVGLYLGMIFAYGGLGPVAEATLASDSAIAVATALITASTLLHFYFDGFIWKVREKSTRRVLGIADAEEGTPDLVVTTHGLKWLLLLLVPAAVLWVTDGRNDHGGNDTDMATTRSLDTIKALAAGAPEAANAWFDLAVALGKASDQDAALAALERTLALNPRHPE
ncbi:MAG: hypothetical protein V3U11_01990, partial [Planctomycetota bacterium]